MGSEGMSPSERKAYEQGFEEGRRYGKNEMLEEVEKRASKNAISEELDIFFEDLFSALPPPDLRIIKAGEDSPSGE